MSRVIGVIDRLDRSLTTVSPVGLTAFGIFSLYYVSLSYGLLVVALAGGKQGIQSVVHNSSSNPGLFFICLPLIPVGLIFLEAADIEGRVLTYWRANVSSYLSSLPVIGKVMDYFWPPPQRVPFISQPSGLASSIDFLSRSIAGGLTLPIVAYYIGNHTFKKSNSLQRIVLVSCMYIYT